ncbi:MAG: SDR family oxidoreductase [Rhodospirillales bacterium]|nr:MAG: SDR family oxidoreductase [Rhodospirillales bacterium]
MTSLPSAGSAPHLFCFGLGYSAATLAERLLQEGWRVSGTCRSESKRQALAGRGIRAMIFDRDRPLPAAEQALATVTDLLSSVPPDAFGDPVLDHHGTDIAAMAGMRWIGYLSTTGVYGDTGGAAVDESAPVNPSSERGHRRVVSEQAWLSLHRAHGLPVHIFRLAGIYGPGRSTLDQVLSGSARRIDRPGHVFSRIHVVDIATILRASMARPEPGTLYNVCDDEPAEPRAVVEYACRLLHREPPPLMPFEQAAPLMSPMAQSFWRDNRRVVNRRVKQALDIRLAFPNYRAGLDALAREYFDVAADRP